MADADTTTVDHDVTVEVRDEPVDVTVEVIPTDDHDPAEPAELRTRVLRDLLSRQLEVSHDLGTELVDAATNVSVAVARAPASVVCEIRGGATLPTALVQSGTDVRDVVNTAGTSLRTAVGDYVGHQATLPSAVVVGASDVAESVLRAQGKVAASAMNATFTVATVVAHGGDVREMANRERSAVGVTTDAARAAIGASWGRAREEIRGAVEGFDEAAEAFADRD